MSDRLGYLVKQFESGSKGSLALGSCGNDWGLSCGTFQMTLRWGNCISFLKKYYPAQSASLYFNNKEDIATANYPGSDYCSSPEQVKEAWIKCYNLNPEKFTENEYLHIENNYYNAIIKKLSNLYYPRSRAMQECLWSWSVHKGSSGAYNGFKSILTKLGITDPYKVSESELFDAIYDTRYSINPYNRYSKNKTSEREVLRPYLDSPVLDKNTTRDSNTISQKLEVKGMNLRKLLLTNNNCYKSGKTMTPKGVMVHSTGANNPWLKRYVGPDDGLIGTNQYGNHWNTATPGGRSVCVHAFIGKLADGSIATYQTLPWNYVGWHSGSGSNGNANYSGYIGFEICEDGLSDATYFNKVYNEAVELCAYLCKAYNIKPESPYLICHSEGHKLGIASNHGDVMHWFPKHGKSMDTFRADVAKILNAQSTTQKPQETKPAATEMYRVRLTWADSKSQIGAYKNLENAKAACKEGYSVFDSKGNVVYTNKENDTPASTPANATTYKVVTNLAGYNNAADAKYRKNKKTTLKAGTYYIYSKYPKGYNGMYNITTDPTGAKPGSWINPNDNKVAVEKAYAPAVGDKVIVTGTIASYGNGGGNKVNVTNKTMYVKELVSSKVYSHYIGVSLTKTSARYGWVKLSSVKKA